MRRAGVILGFVSLLTAGCGGDGQNTIDGSTTSGGAALLGVLVSQWTVTDPSGSLVGSALAAYEADAEARPSWAARLEGSGLRLVLVPEDRLDEIQVAMRARAFSIDRMVAASWQWSVLSASAPVQGAERVRLYDGVLSLSPGTPRLLGRAFPSPGPTSSEGQTVAMMRLDLVPQIEDPPEPTTALQDAVAPRGLRPPEAQGQILASLGVELQLEPGVALIVVPEAIGAEWSRMSPPPEPEPIVISPLEPTSEMLPPAEATGGDGAAEGSAVPTVTRVEFPAAGPIPPAIRSLGERLLSDATEEVPARIRTVLIFRPRVPKEFRILPKGGPEN